MTRKYFAADVIYHVITSGSLYVRKKAQNSSRKMGRHSKATLSCLNNLRHAQKILRAQVEDITDLEDQNPTQNHNISKQPKT